MFLENDWRQLEDLKDKQTHIRISWAPVRAQKLYKYLQYT